RTHRNIGRWVHHQLPDQPTGCATDADLLRQREGYRQYRRSAIPAADYADGERRSRPDDVQLQRRHPARTTDAGVVGCVVRWNSVQTLDGILAIQCPAIWKRMAAGEPGPDGRCEI